MSYVTESGPGVPTSAQITRETDQAVALSVREAQTTGLPAARRLVPRKTGRLANQFVMERRISPRGAVLVLHAPGRHGTIGGDRLVALLESGRAPTVPRRGHPVPIGPGVFRAGAGAVRPNPFMNRIASTVGPAVSSVLDRGVLHIDP